jgi:heme/copper-type cytochrome/quinol oxidase subunit 3
VLAHDAAGRGRGRKAARFLMLTVAGGAVFMVVKAFEYAGELAHGFTPFRDVFWAYYYTATGLHGLHVLAGMVAMALVAAGARRGEHLHRVENVGIYWHFVDAVWIFLFPLLYIAK